MPYLDVLYDCPFCGASDGDIDMSISCSYDRDGKYIPGSVTYFVACTKCGASGKVCKTERGAIEAWNTRQKRW